MRTILFKNFRRSLVPTTAEIKFRGKVGCEKYKALSNVKLRCKAQYPKGWAVYLMGGHTYLRTKAGMPLDIFFIRILKCSVQAPLESFFLLRIK